MRGLKWHARMAASATSSKAINPAREAFNDTVASWKEIFTKAPVNNLLAGVTVAFVALPLNVALAMACGLPPAAGLMTGIIAGVLCGLVGGAKLQISGPEVALAPLTFEIVSRFGLKGLFVATFLAGCFQFVFGALKLGRLVHALPRPVVGGFLAAVGILVLDAQLPRLMGLASDVRLLSDIAPHAALQNFQGASVVLGLVVMACFIFLPKLSPRVPGALIGLVLVSGAIFVTGAQMPTVGSVELTDFRIALPAFHDVDLRALVPEALALALLASIDSLMSAVSLDAVTKGPRHRSEQELMAQGVANIVSSLVGGMPVAGAVVRSMAAVQAGASTRLTSIAHAGALLALLLVAGPLVATLPLTGLAGILVVVGYRLINWRELLFVWRLSRVEAVAFVVTAVAILVGDFVSGVGIGMGVALVHFVVQHRQLGLRSKRGAPLGGGIEATTIVEVNGSIFFASHGQLEALAEHDARNALVLDLRRVPLIDLTGAGALRSLVETLNGKGGRVLMVGSNDDVTEILSELGVVDLLCGKRIFDTLDAAMQAAHDAIAPRPSPPGTTTAEPALGAA